MIRENDTSAGSKPYWSLKERMGWVSQQIEMLKDGGMLTFPGPPPCVYKVDKQNKQFIRLLGSGHFATEEAVVALGWKLIDRTSSVDE